MAQNDIIYTGAMVQNSIKQIHKQFSDAVIKANTLVNIYGITESTTISQDILLYIRFGFPNNGQLTGYVVDNHILYNFITITFDYSLLFPIFDTDYNKEITKGISCTDVLSLIKNKSDLILKFSASNHIIRFDKRAELYNCHICEKSYQILDEIGEPFLDFSCIKRLKYINIPDSVPKTFHLVNVDAYAQWTTNSCFCILLACKNVFVLRWVPKLKKEALDSLFNFFSAQEKVEPLLQKLKLKKSLFRPEYYEGQIKNIWEHNKDYNISANIFFHLGNISERESNELYQFMINNDSRILFAKKDGDKITILGGIKYLLSSEYIFPHCFKHIIIQ